MLQTNHVRIESLLRGLAASLALSLTSVAAQAQQISISAAGIMSVMHHYGAPLHNATNQWGLFGVRLMPIVNGGYTFTGGTTTQTDWGVRAPNGAFGASPYTPTNSAWFYDITPTSASPKPIYEIMGQPANTFAPPTFPPGNQGLVAVSENSIFTCDFTLAHGATWGGGYQFVVDGAEYTLGTHSNPGTVIGDFFGGYNINNSGPGGGLPGNMGPGYFTVTPEAGTLSALSTMGLSAIGLAFRRRRVLTS